VKFTVRSSEWETESAFDAAPRYLSEGTRTCGSRYISIPNFSSFLVLSALPEVDSGKVVCTVVCARKEVGRRPGSTELAPHLSQFSSRCFIVRRMGSSWIMVMEQSRGKVAPQ